MPPYLYGVHPFFDISILKRYRGDGEYIIKWDVHSVKQGHSVIVRINFYSSCRCLKVENKGSQVGEGSMEHHPVE